MEEIAIQEEKQEAYYLDVENAMQLVRDKRGEQSTIFEQKLDKLNERIRMFKEWFDGKRQPKYLHTGSKIKETSSPKKKKTNMVSLPSQLMCYSVEKDQSSVTCLLLKRFNLKDYLNTQPQHKTNRSIRKSHLGLETSHRKMILEC